MVENVGQETLDAAQDALSEEQPAEPQYVTADQMQQMQATFQQAVAQIQRHNAGLESRLDKGVNAIRGELAQASAAGQLANQEAAQQQVLDAIEDPSLKAAMQQLLTGQNTMIRGLTETRVAPETPEPEAAATGQEGWDGVFKMVQSMGVDPNDKRIDYTALTDASLSSQQKLEKFGQSVRAVLTPSATPAATTTTTPRYPTPPRAPGPAASASFANAEAVRDAFIDHQLDQDRYRQEMAKFGQEV